MNVTDPVSPAELEMLTRVLDEYCEDHGCTSLDDRADAASRIMKLYQHGITSPDMLAVQLEKTSQSGEPVF